MEDASGLSLIGIGAATVLGTALWLRTRAPALVGRLLAAAGGAAAGAGALLVQDLPTGPLDWALTLAVMVTLTPVHLRVVLGPFGPPPWR